MVASKGRDDFSILSFMSTPALVFQVLFFFTLIITTLKPQWFIIPWLGSKGESIKIVGDYARKISGGKSLLKF
jgi:hypothetical protein